MKKRLLLLLCLIFAMALFCFSCTEAPDDLPIPEDHSEAKVTYRYQYIRELVPYVQGSDRDWWDCYNQHTLTENGYNGPSRSVKQWTPDMLPDILPNSTVDVTVSRPYSYIKVSYGVAEFLKSGDTSRRDFVLLIIDAKCQHLGKYQYGMQPGERDEWLKRWCDSLCIDRELIGNTGHILWKESDAEQIDKLNRLIDKSVPVTGADDPDAIYDCGWVEEGILVCFPEEIEVLYGFTFEQADILCERGYIDEWCTATVEDSPLYGMTPAEIAAYLADHPELFEEHSAQ